MRKKNGVGGGGEGGWDCTGWEGDEGGGTGGDLRNRFSCACVCVFCLFSFFFFFLCCCCFFFVFFLIRGGGGEMKQLKCCGASFGVALTFAIRYRSMDFIEGCCCKSELKSICSLIWILIRPHTINTLSAGPH